MGTNRQCLPYDITDLIIDFASDPSLCTTSNTSTLKCMLLLCALVCKSWLLHARRRLVSFYFPEGVVKIGPDSQAFFTFRDIFCSPLCTLDPSFIRSLSIDARGYTNPEDRVFPFFRLLSIINEISLPSLDTIYFESACPDFAKDEDHDDNTSHEPSSLALPQVKNLKLEALSYHNSSPLDVIVKTTQFFPYLGSLTVYGLIEPGDQSQYERLPPFRSHSLRKLVVNTSYFLTLVGWLVVCCHTNISSLSIRDDDDDFGEDTKEQIFSALDAVGHSLEEFTLGLYFAPLYSVTI